MKCQKYFKVFAIGLQNEMEYRFNFFIKLFFSLIPFAVNILVWLSVEDYSNTKFGYSLNEMISYYFIILIISNLIDSGVHWGISSDIKTGNINKYLIKPFNYILYNFFLDLPKRIVFLIIGTIPILIVGISMKSYLTVSFNIRYIIYFCIAILIGYFINFLIFFLLSECSFYFTEVIVLFHTFTVLKNIASGQIFPLSIAPHIVYNVLMMTPFPYLGYYPPMILLNNLSDYEIIRSLIIGVVWLILLYILSKFIWKVSLRKYSAFGG